jgi:hypothetical protein
MGAMMTVKYIGEHAQLPSNLLAAVSIGNPFHLGRLNGHYAGKVPFWRIFFGLFEQISLFEMKRKLWRFVSLLIIPIIFLS